MSMFESATRKAYLASFRSFQTWDEVLQYARGHEYMYYQAPLDRDPKYVRIVKVHKNGTIRIDPLSRDADNFTADRKHLDRFRVRG